MEPAFTLFPTFLLYLFEWSDGGWSLKQRIPNPPSPWPSGFWLNGGYEVGANWAFFGIEPRSDGPGKVAVYHRDSPDGLLEFHSHLTPSFSSSHPSDPRDGFGATLAYDSGAERLVVGAQSSGGQNATVRGRAFEFAYEESLDEWREVRRLIYEGRGSSDSDHWNDFGQTVSHWANGWIIGGKIAPSSTGVEAAGRLYVFEDEFAQEICAGSQLSGLDPVLEIGGSNVWPMLGFTATASGLPANELCALLVSPNRVDTPLPGGTGESFCVGAPRIFVGGLGTTSGAGQFDFGVPNAENMFFGHAPGDVSVAQLWFRMPIGSAQPAGLTNALEIEIQ